MIKYYTEYPKGFFYAKNDKEAKLNPAKVVYRDRKKGDTSKVHLILIKEEEEEIRKEKD